MENKIVTMASKKFGTVRKIYEDGKALYCARDIAHALGYAKPNNAISAHCKGALKRGTPTNSGEQQMSFIPEADVYRLICHSKLPSALEFEKWVFEDVVPKAVDKKLNSEPEQLTLETSEYHYFKKTLNGEPVITLIDFEFFAGVTTDIVRYKLYHDGKEGKDYFLLQKRELAAFKTENPNITKSLSALVVITKTGVEKLLKYYGCTVEIPMIEKKKAEIVPITTPEPQTVNTDECIVALNVLRYLKCNCKEWRQKDSTHGNIGMVKKYDEEISAIDNVMKNIGMYVAAGY